MIENYYIYIYLDPREYGRYCYDNVCFTFEPFYIGKGSNDRYKSNCGRTDYFKNKINSIKKSGSKPIVIKLYENLNEKESLDKEIELINEIKKINSKILVNMTDGGEGVSGYKYTEEELKKRRKNFSDIEKEFKKRGYTLLTEEKDYKTNKTLLNYICPEGHKGYISWSNFKRVSGCPICYQNYKNIGENHPNHKLIEQDVIQIKLLLKEGILTQQEIADMFDVSVSTISMINTGKRWPHIKIN